VIAYVVVDLLLPHFLTFLGVRFSLKSFYEKNPYFLRYGDLNTEEGRSQLCAWLKDRLLFIDTVFIALVFFGV
jgi:hypothetical protein